MNEHNNLYIQFPLFLIRGIFADKNAVINKILDYGCYQYSKRLEYSTIDVAKQLIYDLYSDKLGAALTECVKALNSDIIGCNEDYRGSFAFGLDFQPSDEIEEMLTHLDNDNFFTKKAVEYYQMNQVLKSFGINGNIEDMLNKGKQIEMEIPAKEPMPMLNVKMLLNFRDKDKTEFDIAQFMAYMAINSIIGTKQFAKTNKNHIISRMFGFSSIKTIPPNLSKDVRELINKYSKRYQIDKLLRQLELAWSISTYSYRMRCLYVGKNVSLEMMALAGESRRPKVKEERLKKDKDEARKKALRQIEHSLRKP